MQDGDGEKPSERAADPADPDDAGAAGWNDWVRRRFSAEGRLRSGSSGRRSVAVAPAQPELSPAAKSEATRTAVNMLDPRERRLGFFATVLELALTAIVVVPYLNHSHKVSSSELKTMSAVHVFLIEGIVLGAILLLGTLVRRRALLGFASLLVGAWLVEIKALAILGIAYLGFGLWLVVKVLKHSNKEGRGARGGQRGGQRAARQPKEVKSSVPTAKALESRSAPKPNKRYTPPKPSRPVPKKPAPARSEPPKS
jgi:hypothetical protein